MKEFIGAALPWLLLGLALAITAAGYARKKEEKEKTLCRAQLMGMAGGLILGSLLGVAGLFECHALGCCIGVLWGLAISTAFAS